MKFSLLCIAVFKFDFLIANSLLSAAQVALGDVTYLETMTANSGLGVVRSILGILREMQRLLCPHI